MSYYNEQEKNIINGIIKAAREVSLGAKFLEASGGCDQIVITKPTGEELGTINIQSNMGTTFTDPKKIIKSVIYADPLNPLGQNYMLDGIVERGKQCGRELTYEERLGKCANDIWEENKDDIKAKFIDGDFEGDYGDFSELAESDVDSFLIYTKDCNGLMDEATSGTLTNLDYDGDEYDGLEGGRDERDAICSRYIAERYIVSKLEEKFEAAKGDWENEIEGKSPKGPGE